MSRRSQDTVDALLDATERILAREGPSGLSTRRIAVEAGQTHGLIRYHFGSLEQLVIRTLERGTSRILDRQRELYASDQPFLEKWRTAMAFLQEDLTGTFPKLAGELLALGWNDPAYRDALRLMMQGFTEMLTEAVRGAAEEYDVDIDVDAVATLVRTFQLGMLAEGLAGVDLGHAHLLRTVDDWLRALPRREPEGER